VARDDPRSSIREALKPSLGDGLHVDLLHGWSNLPVNDEARSPGPARELGFHASSASLRRPRLASNQTIARYPLRLIVFMAGLSLGEEPDTALFIWSHIADGSNRKAPSRTGRRRRSLRAM